MISPNLVSLLEFPGSNSQEIPEFPGNHSGFNGEPNRRGSEVQFEPAESSLFANRFVVKDAPKPIQFEADCTEPDRTERNRTEQVHKNIIFNRSCCWPREPNQAKPETVRIKPSRTGTEPNRTEPETNRTEPETNRTEPNTFEPNRTETVAK